MRDYHNHLEKDKLDRSWLDKFIKQARARGVTEFGIAEHSYLFAELLPLYQGKIGSKDTPLGRRQHEWLSSEGGKWSLKDYFALLLPLRQQGVKIGLELDWFPGNDQLVRELLAPWPWDYVIGSVHWLDGWVYDIWKDTWQGRDVKAVWQRYIEVVRSGAESQSFDILGHADAIKVYGFYPQPWPEEGWVQLARALAQNKVAVEVNTAFRYRGYSPNFCPDPALLEIFCREGVGLTFGSDAHLPEHAGMFQAEARDYARRAGYTHCLSFTQRRSQRHCLV